MDRIPPWPIYVDVVSSIPYKYDGWSSVDRIFSQTIALPITSSQFSVKFARLRAQELVLQAQRSAGSAERQKAAFVEVTRSEWTWRPAIFGVIS